MTGINGLLPHGFCINWTPALLWSYVISDALITLAYYSIPFALIYFVLRRRNDLKFRRIFLMFGAFILACGTSHLMSILLLWNPVYWLDAGIKMVTATISVITAISLFRVLPQALRLPSPSQLEAEVREREIAQQSLLKSEEQLKVNNEQLTTLIEAIPDAIILKDGAGRWLVTNEPAKKLYRLDNVDWKGKTDAELATLRPEMSTVHEKCDADDEVVWKEGKLGIFEEHVIDEQAGMRQFEVRKAPAFKADGQHKGLVVIGRDVTHSKQVERDLRIADTAFESQEGIVITDANNRILRVNRAFTRMTGYSAEEVIGKTPALLKSGRHDHDFYRSMWEVLTREKFWQGEIWDKRKNGEIYPKWLTLTAVCDSDGVITNYVGAFTDLSEIHRLAFYDPLTDLPNRRLLRDRLQLALTSTARNQQYCAVILMDLDNFKTINDTKGHEIGDQLLIEVAQRLRTCVRQGDTVVRLGGDEFVIMLENLSTDEQHAAIRAEAVGEKILDAINQPYQLQEHKLHSSPSIGISLFAGQNVTAEEILKRADTAMYQAKNAGRNTIRFYDPEMQALLEARISLESELRLALPGNQFQLYYQVQVDNRGRALGAEALLRWAHPERGLIPPGEFIPLAEESGLILPIGEWVLQSACEQLKAWEANPLTRELKLSINVSARQFRQADFVQKVCAVLDRTGVNASQLKLELTESLVHHNVTDTIEKMEALKLLGIRFSMDDFGTGYSSLTYLKQLPLNQLKIDQSFVRDIATSPNDEVIAQTIIGMAKNLGLSVIAEGVETEAQHACLERLGCTAFQGYLFGKPMPVQSFLRLLKHDVEHANAS